MGATGGPFKFSSATTLVQLVIYRNAPLRCRLPIRATRLGTQILRGPPGFSHSATHSPIWRSRSPDDQLQPSGSRLQLSILPLKRLGRCCQFLSRVHRPKRNWLCVAADWRDFYNPDNHAPAAAIMPFHHVSTPTTWTWVGTTSMRGDHIIVVSGGQRQALLRHDNLALMPTFGVLMTQLIIVVAPQEPSPPGTVLGLKLDIRRSATRSASQCRSSLCFGFLAAPGTCLQDTPEWTRSW